MSKAVIRLISGLLAGALLFDIPTAVAFGSAGERFSFAVAVRDGDLPLPVFADQALALPFVDGASAGDMVHPLISRLFAEFKGRLQVKVGFRDAFRNSVLDSSTPAAPAATPSSVGNALEHAVLWLLSAALLMTLVTALSGFSPSAAVLGFGVLLGVMIPFGESFWGGSRPGESRPDMAAIYLDWLQGFKVGHEWPLWQWANLTMAVLLDRRQAGDFSSLSRAELINQVLRRIAAHGLGQDNPTDRAGVSSVLGSLVERGLLRKTEKDEYALEMDADLLAVKVKDVAFIQNRLAAVLGAFRPDDESAIRALDKVLRAYGEISERWPLYPVEARRPVLQAMAIGAPESRQVLGRFLRALYEAHPAGHPPAFRSYLESPAAQTLRRMPLMADLSMDLLGEAPARLVPDFAPNLKNRTVYNVATEGWLSGESFGRGQQQQVKALSKLLGQDGQVVTVEPYYTHSLSLDHGSKVVERPPLAGSKTPSMEFSLVVKGKPMTAQVFERDMEGMKAYFIRDIQEDGSTRITRVREAYLSVGQDKDPSGAAKVGLDEFSEFFFQAFNCLYKRLEQDRKERMGENYRRGAVLAHGAPMRDLVLAKKELGGAVVAFVSSSWDSYRQRTDSAVSAADVAWGVSAVQRDLQLSPRNPGTRVLAVTQGRDRQAARQLYRDIFRHLYPGRDDENPTGEQMLGVHQTAKERLNDSLERELSPDVKEALGLAPGRPIIRKDQLLAAYSGRMNAKVGIHPEMGVFSQDNLQWLVEQGVQVVIYGNVTEVTHTSMLSNLEQLAQKLNRPDAAHPNKGRLIVRIGCTGEDEQELLTAAELSVRGMDNESIGPAQNGTAMGALIVGPMRPSGTVQELPLDQERPGVGNTFIAPAMTSEAFRGIFEVANQWYRTEEGRLRLASYQITSMRLSRATDVLPTALEVLRQLDRAVERKENPMSALMEISRGDPLSSRFFWPQERREDLVNYLAGQEGGDPVSHRGLTLVEPNPYIRARHYLVHLPNGQTAIASVDPLDPADNDTRPVFWTHIRYPENEQAFRELLGADPGNPDLEFVARDLLTGQTFPEIHTMKEVREKGFAVGIPRVIYNDVSVPRLGYPDAKGKEIWKGGVQLLVLIPRYKSLLPTQVRIEKPVADPAGAFSNDSTVVTARVRVPPGVSPERLWVEIRTHEQPLEAFGKPWPAEQFFRMAPSSRDTVEPDTYRFEGQIPARAPGRYEFTVGATVAESDGARPDSARQERWKWPGTGRENRRLIVQGGDSKDQGPRSGSPPSAAPATGTTPAAPPVASGGISGSAGAAHGVVANFAPALVPWADVFLGVLLTRYKPPRRQRELQFSS